MLLRTTFVFERTAEDVMVCSQDWFGADNETFPTTGTNTFEAISARADAFWTACRDVFPAQLTLREVRYYREDDNVLPYGEVAVIHPIELPGTCVTGPFNGPGALPWQIACTTTKRTSLRRHWGRLYWPGLDRSHYNPVGRWNMGAVAQLNTAYGNFVQGVRDDTIWGAIVLSSNVLLLPNTTSVLAVRTDEVPDVMRSRRPDMTGAFANHAINLT